MTEDHFLINMYVEAGRTNLMASTSASAKRIEVRYAGGIIYVSPKDYVVVHELCHRKEMNHSAAFWNEVAKVLPDYIKSVRWLKDEGGRLMNRMM